MSGHEEHPRGEVRGLRWLRDGGQAYAEVYAEPGYFDTFHAEQQADGSVHVDVWAGTPGGDTGDGDPAAYASIDLPAEVWALIVAQLPATVPPPEGGGSPY